MSAAVPFFSSQECFFLSPRVSSLSVVCICLCVCLSLHSNVSVLACLCRDSWQQMCFFRKKRMKRGRRRDEEEEVKAQVLCVCELSHLAQVIRRHESLVATLLWTDSWCTYAIECTANPLSLSRCKGLILSTEWLLLVNSTIECITRVFSLTKVDYSRVSSQSSQRKQKQNCISRSRLGQFAMHVLHWAERKR